MKIKTKIQWYSMFFLTVMLLMLSILVAIAFFWLSLQREQEFLEEQAQLIEENVGLTSRFADIEPMIPDDGMVRIYHGKENAVSPFTEEEELFALKTKYVSEDDFELSKVDGEYVLTYRLPVKNKGQQQGVIEVSQPIESVIDHLVMLTVVLLAMSLFVIFISIFASKRLATLILKPVSIMSRTMVEIEQSGQFKKIPLPDKAKDELEQMGAAFNRMMARLEQNYYHQQQFLSDASHELKTPITVIESYASLLKRWGKEEADIQEEAVEAIHHEALRMKELTQNLLQVASKNNLSIEKVEIVSLCRQVARNFSQTSNRIVQVIAKPEEVTYETDANRFEQVLIILVDNALKYSETDVTVSIEVAEEVLMIRVQDQGVGIPKQDIPHVFERFYRVDPSRTRSTGGSGLGLSIAKSIVDSLGGRIAIESEVGVGTTVNISFLIKF
ncbi:sensor histidine kinase [Peribacillus asahii]|uniref:sensor histidine kinase n=1 Tax=Peribacillus asahii TaxID=228899 RepID=UPI0020798A2D|nr:HAMP domain-containing sensor histidine kinase [Peribacillus asahii]USK59431.1 HAMP domain-containing histidine kinase [Peribacillus asahii]